MAQVTIEQAVQIGLQHHMAGRYGEAEGIYRQVLGLDPNQVEALHLLGALAHQVGKSEAGVELLRRAVALRPGYVEAWNNLGLALQDTKKLDEAVSCYRRAIELKPELGEAHSNLGYALFEKREFVEAEAACRRAATLAPGLATAHHNWGNALAELGRKEEAVAAYRRAIGLKADYAEVFASLGVVLVEMGRVAEGVRELQRALEIKPDHLNGLVSLAEILKGQKRHDEAVMVGRRAVAAAPKEARAWRVLGNALGAKQQMEEAVAALERAIGLAPNEAEPMIDLGVVLANNGREEEALGAFERVAERFAEHAIPWSNIGQLQREAGRVEAGLAACRRAIEMAPDFADAHANYALGLLVTGEFTQGWAEYDWRLKSRAFNLRRQFAKPMWQGEEVAGKRIFLWYEQGLGDTLQFVRYAGLLAARGAPVMLECQPELARLLRGVEGLTRVIAEGDGKELPEFDVHCPLLSVPGGMGTTAENIPAVVPYVKAPDEVAAVWRERVEGSSEVQRVEVQKGKRALRVGLAWAGNPKHRQDKRRSIKLEALRGLAEIEGVEWYSLQKGPQAGQLREAVAGGWKFIDHTQKLTDFAETAGLVEQLDLVISIDSAVAHLAGAMGKAVWVFVPYAPDWRWLLEGEKTPWYPTMRLFRQRELGRWEEVIEWVRGELRMTNGEWRINE